MPWLERGLAWSVSISGVAGMFCSVMIYTFTQRECWTFSRVAVRFLLTAAVLGVATVWLSILILTLATPSAPLAALVRGQTATLSQTLCVAAGAKLLWEAAIFRHLLLRRLTALKRSAFLLSGELGSFTLAQLCRWLCLVG